MMTVLLDDGTIGTTEHTKVGYFCKVKLHDENGNDICVCGEVVEILKTTKH